MVPAQVVLALDAVGSRMGKLNRVLKMGVI